MYPFNKWFLLVCSVLFTSLLAAETMSFVTVISPNIGTARNLSAKNTTASTNTVGTLNFGYSSHSGDIYVNSGSFKVTKDLTVGTSSTISNLTSNSAMQVKSPKLRLFHNGQLEGHNLKVIENVSPQDYTGWFYLKSDGELTVAYEGSQEHLQTYSAVFKDFELTDNNVKTMSSGKFSPYKPATWDFIGCESATPSSSKCQERLLNFDPRMCPDGYSYNSSKNRCYKIKSSNVKQLSFSTYCATSDKPSLSNVVGSAACTLQWRAPTDSDCPILSNGSNPMSCYQDIDNSAELYGKFNGVIRAWDNQWRCVRLGGIAKPGQWVYGASSMTPATDVYFANFKQYECQSHSLQYTDE